MLSLLLITSFAHATEIKIGVLELFHPKTLRLRASAIALGADRLPMQDQAEITADRDTIICRFGGHELKGIRLTAEGPNIHLSVPGKLDRTYRGRLHISAANGELHPVITMDLEEAVASTVAAEMPNAPAEALKAQAIASRSYFQARPRHTAFDFCDATHCQWLQGSRAPSQAAKQTAGITLRFQGKTLDAMYFRSCAGTTLRAVDIQLDPSAYPYYAVDCEVCRRKPYTWESKLPLAAVQQLLTKGPSENLRLQLTRQYGWSQLPSNTYTAETKADAVIFKGKGEGHGLGLCQRGAIELSKSGTTAAQILRHYYPATTLSPDLR